MFDLKEMERRALDYAELITRSLPNDPATRLQLSAWANELRDFTEESSTVRGTLAAMDEVLKRLYGTETNQTLVMGTD